MSEFITEMHSPGISPDASSSESKAFGDIITSIEQFRQHSDTLLHRVNQQQQSGIEHMRQSRLAVLTLVRQCVAVLEGWQRQLCGEVTGMTTVGLAELQGRKDDLLHCRDSLDSALKLVKNAVQSGQVASELVELSISLHDGVDEAANTVLKLDAVKCPAWPEVSLNPDPGSFSEVLGKLSARALGHVPSAVHVREAVKGLARARVPRELANVCREGEYITLRLQVSSCGGDVSGRAVVPYLSSEVCVGGSCVSQCALWCTPCPDDDATVEVWLQAPPCSGFGELSISVHCFLQHVPGSPVLLTLQGGPFSGTARPAELTAATELPRTSELEGGADPSNRSVQCGCICGKLAAARRVTSSDRDCSSDTDSRCSGECMLELSRKECGFVTARTTDIANATTCSPGLTTSADSARHSSVDRETTGSTTYMTGNNDTTGNINDMDDSGVNWDKIITDKDDLTSFMNITVEEKAYNAGRVTTAAAVQHSVSSTTSEDVIIDDDVGHGRGGLSASSPLFKTPTGSSLGVASSLNGLKRPVDSMITSLSSSSAVVQPECSPVFDISLEVKHNERRTLELSDDYIDSKVKDNRGSALITSVAKKMREGFSSSQNIFSTPPTSSRTRNNTTNSAAPKHAPIKFGETSPTAATGFSGLNLNDDFESKKTSFPSGANIVASFPSGTIPVRGPLMARRPDRPPGPLRRPNAEATKMIFDKENRHSLPARTPDMTSGPEVVRGGDFISLDASQSPVVVLRTGSADHSSNPSSDAKFNPNALEYTPALRTYNQFHVDDAAVNGQADGRNRGATSTADTNASVVTKTPATSFLGETTNDELGEVAEQSDMDRLCGQCVSVYGTRTLAGGGGSAPSSSLKSPVGVTQLPDGSVVVCDTFNDRLVKYSSSGDTVEVFNSSPTLHKPSAVVMLADSANEDGAAVPAVESEDEAVFAVKDHFAIYVFNGQCRQLRALGKKVLRRPYGLTVDDEGQLVTVETGVKEQPAITRVDPSTGELRRVHFDLLPEDRRNQGNVSKPRFIAYHRDEVLIVVDLGLDVVAMVSMVEGSVLRKFGRPGTGPGQFRDPSGVVCDADGYIILGDSRNHRIQVFSPNGEFLSVLRVDRPLKRPSGLCLTPCGHLLVINYWENTVAKYKLTV